MCGARSYRPVIRRDSLGAMRPSGVNQCSGCSTIFTDPKDWYKVVRSDLLPASSDQVRLKADEASATAFTSGQVGVGARLDRHPSTAGAQPY